MSRTLLLSAFQLLVASSVLIAMSDETREVSNPRNVLKTYEKSLTAVRSYDLAIEAKHRMWIDTQGTVTPARKIEIRERRKLDRPLEKREYFRQVMDGNRSRIDRFEPDDLTIARTIVSENKTDRSIVYGKPNEAMIKPNRNGVCSDGADYREAYSNVLWRIPILKSLNDRETLKALQIGQSRYLFTTEPEPKRDVNLKTSSYRVTFDVDKGFFPSSVQLFRPSKSGQLYLNRHMQVMEWKEIEKGVWVPIRAITRWYTPPDDKVPNELNNEVEMIVDLAKSRWNRNIDGSAFQLDFPPGTIVTDLIRNIRYVVGEEDPSN